MVLEVVKLNELHWILKDTSDKPEKDDLKPLLIFRPSMESKARSETTDKEQRRCD